MRSHAVVISPREVMINAKGIGRATLMIWETGADPARWEIQVVKDTSEWDTFARTFTDAAGAPISRADSSTASRIALARPWPRAQGATKCVVMVAQ